MDIVTGDIKEAAEIFKPAFFDVITTNPPYMIADHGLRNPADARRSHGMRCFVHLMIFCGRVCAFCRIREDLYDTPSIQADGDYD